MHEKLNIQVTRFTENKEERKIEQTNVSEICTLTQKKKVFV